MKTHVRTGTLGGFFHAALAIASLLSLVPNSTFASTTEDALNPQVGAEIAALLAEKASWTAAQKKMESHLVQAAKHQRGQPFAPAAQHLKFDLKTEPDGRVLVDIDAKVTEGLLAEIRGQGGSVLSSFPQFHAIRALVTLDQLEKLAGAGDVKFIRRAARAMTNTGSVTSEGDVTHRADFARSAFGVDGRGVKIGVLSDSIDFLADAQSTGDLGDVTILPGQSGVPGSGEGTAMLEIIHDLAPQAQLYFATAFNGEASFAQNILDLRSNGCQVIIDDVYYFDEPPFQDGIIARAINTVTASGALYFSSAGNDGNKKDGTSCTWEGDFVDGGPVGAPFDLGGGRVHNFGGAPFNTVLNGGWGVDLFWADPLGASTNDYDLFLLDSTGSYVIASSLNLQNGTQDPYEFIPMIPDWGNRIVIVKTSGASRFLHVVTSRGQLSIGTTGATRGHSAAAAAFGVAAVNASSAYPLPFTGGNSNPVETFSSDGPRRVFFNPDGSSITPGNYSSSGGTLLQKPDLAAADGVATSLYYFDPFFGTSASAPHAGAIAALLWSYDPSLTLLDVRNALLSTALDIEDPGVDRNSGAGIVMTDLALQSLPPKPVVVVGQPVFLAEQCLNGAVDPGERVTLGFTLSNIGPADATNLVATLLNSGGIVSPSAPQSYGLLAAGGGSANRPFSFTSSGTCGATNIATLQLQDGARDLGTVSVLLTLGKTKVALAESFDGVSPPGLPVGWTLTSSGSGAAWSTVTDASDSPPNSVFVPDPYGTSDNALFSPLMAIMTTSAQLSFRHSLSTYSGYFDGGVLEISINGGDFRDILAAGGAFVANGYTGTLNTGYGNPLGGRLAWTGYTGGFITTIAKLPAAAANQRVQLRWRYGSSSSFGGSGGWYIDTVAVTDGSECCVAVPNDLAVGISGSPDPVLLGAPLTYTITVLNTGPDSAQNVSILDELPPGFTLQSVTVLPPGVLNGPVATNEGTLRFDAASFPAGTNVNIVIIGSGNSGVLTNRVAVTRSDTDADLANNTATAITTVSLPRLSISGVSLIEGDSATTNANFAVTLSSPVSRPVTVNYATSDGTALAGTDYLAGHGTLVFEPGVIRQTIAIPVIGDIMNEPSETFVVTLSSPSNAVMNGTQALCTIINDDPLPNIAISDATLLQPGGVSTNAAFQVSLSTPSGRTVSVSYHTLNGTAAAGADYEPVYSMPLTFNPGETNKSITVVVKDHASARPSQTFQVVLEPPSNAKVARGTGVGTIITSWPGQVDHFVWSAIAPTQAVGAPFAVTITAQDFWNNTASNYNGNVGLSATRATRTTVAGLKPGAVIAYFSDNNPWLTGPAGPISQAGFTPLQVTEMSTLNLNNCSALFVDEVDNSYVSTSLRERLPQILDWVNKGGTLIVHDRSAGNIQPNPFLVGTTGIQTWRHATSDIDVVPPGENLVIAGPFGTINNTTLDGGNSSAHGYVLRSELPASSLSILSVGGNPDQVVDFSYILGSGAVYYSSIPLDCYLAGGDCGGSPLTEPLQHVYTPNILAYLADTEWLIPLAVAASPTNSGNFSNGVWSATITVGEPGTNVTLHADDGHGHTGSSGPFDVEVVAGQVSSFAWNPVPSPQTSGVPFAVTVFAQDFFRTTVTNFNGTVALAAAGVSVTTNTILPSPSSAYASSGVYTLGYAFTPKSNMTVTHFRHYFGNKVSLWTDAGVLVATRNVNSVPGSWVETPLVSPVQLMAGTRYRLGVYTAGGTFYYRSDMAASFLHGEINQSYEYYGDGFPSTADSYLWILVDLKYTAASPIPVPVGVTPSVSASFTNGIWRGSVTLERWGVGAILKADDGLGHAGFSNPFDVTPGRRQLDHLVWSAVVSPQAVGEPFEVTLTARDYYNALASNFAGTVSLTGIGTGGLVTNTILSSPSHTDYSSGSYTLGYAFTPSTNLTVTHVRHYFGTKVSIWSDSGTLLASQAVTSIPGTWLETPLATPLNLTAGTRYRVAAFSGGGNYYWRTAMDGAFINGTIDQGYEGSGDGFPFSMDSVRWWFVDLKYTTGAGPTTVPIAPGVSGNFVSGVWTGSVSVAQEATNLILQADDGRDHVGLSNPVNVGARGQVNHFVWETIFSPQYSQLPFEVTVTAKDLFNDTATNFSGAVALNATGSMLSTNTMLYAPVLPYSESGYNTLGYAFTPDKDITVTHVRHYFGNKVSIWTDSGVLLANRIVTSVPGTWVETLLTSPVQLRAGTRYRLTVYVGSGTYYYRSDMPGVFPDGTINQAYEAYGDTFPTSTSSYHVWTFVDLKYTAAAPFPVTLSVTNSDNFSGGVWHGKLTVPMMSQLVTNVVVRAHDGNGHLGLSNPFSVVPPEGTIDHLAWSAIDSPQAVGEAFGVTVSARDYYNKPVTNFTGPVVLSGVVGPGIKTNTVLSSPSSTSYTSGSYTVGYSFTPNTNLTVTHLRHYFGTRVSIWNEAGILLASQGVVSVPGTWIETPLPTPLQLTAGARYRIGAYTAGADAYYRYDLPPVFPNGIINQGYEISGDAFPAWTDNMRWWFVDFKYTVGSPPTSVPVIPALSGDFVGGTWTGTVAVTQAVTNLLLQADDGFGHTGASSLFNVLPRGKLDHFTWNSIASPQFPGLPIHGTIVAQDCFNLPVTNFGGRVLLTASASKQNTNSILPAPLPLYSSSGDYTLGYAFTPSRDLKVTHVRYYFGSKFSIWTDDGVLVVTQTIPNAPGVWREAPLASPVQLAAGRRYRVAVWTAGGSYYWRTDMASSFTDGTINQGYEGYGDTFPGYSDSYSWMFVDLKYTVTVPVPVELNLAQSDNFTNGLWSGTLTVTQLSQPVSNVVVRADDGFGHSGSSNPFAVIPVPGQIDHLAWTPIASRQAVGVPFGVTVTAQDYYNATATGFVGTVALGGSWPKVLSTNTILPSPSHSYSISGAYTVGYSFTPSTNITVTHVRHYGGIKVSIWTELGTLLASRSVPNVQGTWTETPLITSLQLAAGTRYRVGVYTGGGNYFYRTDMAAAFTNGTINEACQGSGDAFPGYSDSTRWAFVDLKYTVSVPSSVALVPSVSGNFSGGTWSNSMVVAEGANNLVLLADDGQGHTGLSNPFNVVLPPRAPVFVRQPSGKPVFTGNLAAMHALVSGTTPLSYQWIKDGLPIPGATSPIYWILNVQTNDAARYSLVVTNLLGSASSTPATLTVVSGGPIVAWGDNGSGQADVPSGLNDTMAVAGGYSHSLALRKDGTVLAWGDNSYGQANVPPGLQNVTAVAAGYYHNLAIQTDGTVVAWGDNTDGQTNVPPGLSSVVAVAGGGFHSLALRRNGTVVAWGYNGYGQVTTPAGLSNVVAIAAGAFHSLALRRDGTLVAWGWNSDGQTNVPSSGQPVIAVAGGRYHSLAAFTDGTLVGWGFNGSGQAMPPAALSNALAVAGGGDYSLALCSDGTVKAWGNNFKGQTSAPADLTNVASIATGYAHGLALVAYEPPVLLSQPQDVAVVYGGGARFEASYAGALPLDFQWLKNGSNLPGATAGTLQFAGVTRADDADYRVVVTNVFGSLTSLKARLRVLAPQEFTRARMETNGAFHLVFADAEGGGVADPSNIQVFAATNLLSSDMVWVAVTNGTIVLTNGALLFEDPDAAKYSRRFYKVLERP